MNDAKKRLGRPPKPETLDRREAVRREKEMFANPPAYACLPGKRKLVEWLANIEQVEQEILRGYDADRTFSHEHIFEMASLGDESMFWHEEVTIQKDKKLREKAGEFRRAGAAARNNAAAARYAELCRNNRFLIGRIRPLGPLTLEAAAKKIHNYWTALPLEYRLAGEENLQRRGVRWTGLNADERPSLRTIIRAIQSSLTRPSRLNGQTSRYKK